MEDLDPGQRRQQLNNYLISMEEENIQRKEEIRSLHSDMKHSFQTMMHTMQQATAAQTPQKMQAQSQSSDMMTSGAQAVFQMQPAVEGPMPSAAGARAIRSAQAYIHKGMQHDELTNA